MSQPNVRDRMDHPKVKHLSQRWLDGDPALLSFIEALAKLIIERMPEHTVQKLIEDVGDETLADRVSAVACSVFAMYPGEIRRRLNTESPSEVAQGLSPRLVFGRMFERGRWYAPEELGLKAN